MPEMDGYQVLEQMKRDRALRDLPVIVISALDEIDSVVRCIEMGAEDYLTKPFDQVLLRARIGACLEKKYLRDQEQAYLHDLQVEREKSERLLLNVLPRPVAERLKQGEAVIADHYSEVTVLFADIVAFTLLAGRMPPVKLVILLNDVFSAFDQLAAQYGLEKIKTIGDNYLIVGGLPTPRPDHAEAIAEMALGMQRVMCQFKADDGQPVEIRVGIHIGPVVAGVIGKQKFGYDLWGATVNIASRMQSQGIAGRIQVTDKVFQRLRYQFIFEERGIVSVKNIGDMKTYFLNGKK
jgi:adenylate cyclase